MRPEKSVPFRAAAEFFCSPVQRPSGVQSGFVGLCKDLRACAGVGRVQSASLRRRPKGERANHHLLRGGNLPP